jgi:Recombination endonuclease VII
VWPIPHHPVLIGEEMKTHCINGHEFTEENTWINPKDNTRICKICKSANYKRCREKHRERHLLRKNESQAKQLYGWTLADRDSLLTEQGNACAICGRTDLTWGKGFNDVWHTDHEHGKDGTHRGILCATCNTALGKLEPFMDKVIAYLAKYAGTEVLPNGETSLMNALS